MNDQIYVLGSTTPVSVASSPRRQQRLNRSILKGLLEQLAEQMHGAFVGTKFEEESLPILHAQLRMHLEEIDAVWGLYDGRSLED